MSVIGIYSIELSLLLLWLLCFCLGGLLFMRDSEKEVPTLFIQLNFHLLSPVH